MDRSLASCNVVRHWCIAPDGVVCTGCNMLSGLNVTSLNYLAHR